jgi:hypothetical protein
MGRQGRSRRAAVRRWYPWLIALLLVTVDVVPLAVPPPVQATAPVFAIGIGTTGIDRGLAIDVDSEGNIYAAGSYGTTADFDPGPGVTSFTSNGSDDAWVAKYSKGGALVWAKSYGAFSVDNPTGLVVDSTGVYVTGFFSGTVNFGLGDLVGAGNSDVFVIKLSLTDGSTIWQQRFGSTTVDRGQAIAISGTGLYVTGRFQGTVNFGGGDLASAGGDDVFVLRLNASDGAHVWSKRFGGPSTAPGEDIGLGVASDGTGVYVTGFVTEAVNFGGGFRIPFGGEDIFVIRLAASNGSHVWSRRFGAAENDRGNGVVVDTTGVYVTGRFRRTVNFGGGGLSSGDTDASTQDVFAVKLALANGTHTWSRRFGDTFDDRGAGLALSGGSVLITGRYQGTVDFGTVLTSVGGPPPSADAFVAALSAGDGGPAFAYSLGGPSQDEAYAVATGGTVAYTTGEFAGTANFGAGVATLNLTSGGSQDAFISTVDLANVPPQISAPRSVNASANTTFVFGATPATSVTMSDADAGTQPVGVQLIATHGRLTLASTSGLSFTAGDGANDAAMTFTGSLSSVNAGLDGMGYRPDVGFTGAAGLTIQVTDQGAVGIDGPKTANRLVAITVGP